MMPTRSCKALAVMTASLGLVFGGITLAVATEPAVDLIKARQQSFKELGNASKSIRDELRASTPDARKLQVAAADVKKAAASIDAWFPKGTGPESGVKTTARAEIWSDAVGFAVARDRFVDAANKFADVAVSGDAAARDERFRALGQTCKGCHEKYRVRED